MENQEIKTQELNIFQRMSKITEKINRVAKNLQVGVGKSQYKAVGEADVLAEVKPAEIEFGVYSYPLKREIVYSNEFTSTKAGYDGEVKEVLTMFMRVKTIYRFVNIDKPSEFVDIETYGDGVDTQDKAPGKAMTYGDKYALLKAYKIETGDDPDQNGSGELGKKKPQNNTPKPTEPTEPTISAEQKQKLVDFGVDLQEVATYCKCATIDLVTYKEAERIIKIKEKNASANKGEANGK